MMEGNRDERFYTKSECESMGVTDERERARAGESERNPRNSLVPFPCLTGKDHFRQEKRRCIQCRIKGPLQDVQC